LEKLYKEHTNKENAKVFKALCDEERLHILEMLRNGEKCACKLLENMDIGQSSLSYHMKILVESGIVESRQDGKWTYYKISDRGRKYAVNLIRELTAINNISEKEN
jgi:ArsR family transcriptional regulator